MHKSKLPTILQTYAPLLWRVFAFLIAFLIASGVIGPRIIGHGLVGKYGFGIYGGAGKALLFSAVALMLLVYKKGTFSVLKPWRKMQALWLVGAVVALYGAWFAVGKLIAGAHGVSCPVLAHAGMLATIVFAALGVFGIANLRTLTSAYKRELLISIALAIAFFGWLYAVYGLWQVLATVVLHAVSWLLGVSGVWNVVLPHHSLLLNKFAVQISEYCSGIDSIALFSGLYAVVGLVDWQRFNHRRFLAAFVPALILLFVCNILRVYALIMAGYYINPHIAFSLFHTYAGMVYFIFYSAVFWGVSYKWMMQSYPGKKGRLQV